MQGDCRLLVLIHAGIFHLPPYRITFPPFVKAVFGKIPGKNTRSLVAVLPGGVVVDAGLEQLPAAELQQLAARLLVKGDDAPLRVHSHAPDGLALLPLHDLTSCADSLCLSFYAITA